jgi:hypothetical protein
MPYIKEENRKKLDNCIEEMMKCLRYNVTVSEFSSILYKEKLNNEELLSICGDINYTFSRILAGIMGDVSYPKIAIITGVLENIKQEYYRRVAEIFEDHKILANGDIKEYKHIK